MMSKNDPFAGLRQPRLLVARLVDGVLFALQASVAAISLLQVSPSDAPSICMTLGSLVAITLLRWLVMRRTAIAGYRGAYDGGLHLRAGVLRRLIRLPLGAFQALERGRLVQAFGEDVLWLENEASSTQADIAFNAAAMTTLLVSALAVSPLPAVAAILFLMLGFLFLRLLAKRLERGFGRRARGLEQAALSTSEFCEGMPVLRAFSAAERCAPGFERQVEQLRLGARKGVLFATPLAVMFRGLVDLAAALAIALSLSLSGGQDGDLGRLAASCLLLAATVIPARNFAALMAMQALARIARTNIGGILAQADMTHGDRSAPAGQGGVIFRDVSFRYPGQEREALDRVSFEARPGTLTALVGHNGSGKTTCLQLLMRFRDVSGGAITIGETDIRDLTPDALASCYAPVFQEALIVHDTVAANIRLGRPDASDDEVIAAAKQAAIHDTIMARGGYDTVVAPLGRNFSGGELQRIAIARAILKDAPVVLLDEATSALDPEGEHLIQVAINALIREKTVIVVAHRLSTIAEADNIIVLDQGRAEASGRHDDLLRSSQQYRNLWRRFAETGAEQS
ncbi:ATP-binding cassette subfamily B protein [Peteryoungia aggregata LMG 23059]|uniref:ATP-binding cassette subfamily B protein n=1 Tax=Peteryoungia aggregata LMG 23059 TaxID=1368425 RepID=A0ABU0G4K9_9HYPH|nr:ABC transporter ATP-binding protein [Peteryoungia aggregata]MDQ0420269.1 ATP-binding cassette subfamily B protein [Peteryoungia aggregata LMG 23059]